ncbi:MAG: stage II sporulation protein M [bacterium]
MSTVLWWMARPWGFVWGPLDGAAVAAAAVLFAVGLALGMTAERRDIRWAAAWGRYVLRRLEAWLGSRRRSIPGLVALISAVNILSTGLIVAACRIPPLSLLLLLAVGVNTGVMAQRLGGGKAWLALLMPHAWIELPAVITASAAALQATAFRAGLGWFDLLADPTWATAFFLKAAVPLLIGAAVIEALLMVGLSDLPVPESLAEQFKDRSGTSADLLLEGPEEEGEQEGEGGEGGRDRRVEGDDEGGG